ncbi:HIRAN domain-containing protein [Collinsella sp. D33t1_170424_A12]|uniref:HIRAN domain-containing protein n=1 Tax=Collinsella sp. D33t1_170424_A12 TaxID=2787135 RepID=UPI001E458F15|nr:HIRAN domain-containing protein [Collinsella sp. D33t1_170424_A12]
MYEPSRNIMNFYVAGFQYHEGALVLSQLKPGDELTLEAQPDNPHDADAIAIKAAARCWATFPPI